MAMQSELKRRCGFCVLIEPAESIGRLHIYWSQGFSPLIAVIIIKRITHSSIKTFYFLKILYYLSASVNEKKMNTSLTHNTWFWWWLLKGSSGLNMS